MPRDGRAATTVAASTLHRTLYLLAAASFSLSVTASAAGRGLVHPNLVGQNRGGLLGLRASLQGLACASWLVAVSIAVFADWAAFNWAVAPAASSSAWRLAAASAVVAVLRYAGAFVFV